MNNYFEYKLNYNKISFCYTNKTEIDEREIHTYNEILFYMGEETSFLTEKFKRSIKKNTLVFIPKEKYHYFDNGKKRTLPRLKIGFSDVTDTSLLGEIKVIENLSEMAYFSVKRLCEALENLKDKSDKIAALGAFYIVLSEIIKNDSTLLEKNSMSYIVSECVEYINENLKKAISIKKLSEKLNVSESALTHSFKKEMGISVHKYIQQKRLVFAKTLIEEGKRPTKIYLDCGYNEYSAFYKAYLKMFGCPPSEKLK